MLQRQIQNNRKLIVICIGNRYRSDDAIGSIIYDKLKDKNFHNVSVIENDNDGLSIIQEWSERDYVIIVDAVSSGSAAGTIFRFDLLREKIPYDSIRFSTHNINLADAVELATRLNRLPAELRLFAIEGRLFNFGESMSSEVRMASEVVLDEITNLCSKWLGEY